MEMSWIHAEPAKVSTRGNSNPFVHPTLFLRSMSRTLSMQDTRVTEVDKEEGCPDISFFTRDDILDLVLRSLFISFFIWHHDVCSMLGYSVQPIKSVLDFYWGEASFCSKAMVDTVLGAITGLDEMMKAEELHQASGLLLTLALLMVQVWGLPATSKTRCIVIKGVNTVIYFFMFFSLLLYFFLAIVIDSGAYDPGAMKACKVKGTVRAKVFWTFAHPVWTRGRREPVQPRSLQSCGLSPEEDTSAISQLQHHTLAYLEHPVSERLWQLDPIHICAEQFRHLLLTDSVTGRPSTVTSRQAGLTRQLLPLPNTTGSRGQQAGARGLCTQSCQTELVLSL